MQNTKEVLAAFRDLHGARVNFADAGPAGRLAVLLYFAEDGFVWIEPGYQDPFNSSPKARYLDGPLELADGVLTFPGGTITEAVGGNLDCFMYWLEHCRDSGRNGSQEREDVLHGLLGGEFNGRKLT